MSVNNAASYIVAFFNYTEAFSLFGLTALIFTGFQESCEVCHFLECNFNSLRVFMANNESVLSDSSFIHITMLSHHYYFYKNESKILHNTLKDQCTSFSGSSDIKLQRS